jgi:hypothetical protein
MVSGTGQPLHARLIGQIRTHYQLPSHPQRLRDAGLLTLVEIARRLAIHPHTVKKWRNAGLLTGRLANDKGEYLYQLPGPDLAPPAPDDRPATRAPQPKRQPHQPQEVQCEVNWFAFGACTGVVMTCAPSEANTSSKGRVNLAS